MFIGIGKTLPQIADLPGSSRPGYPSGPSGDEEFIIRVKTDISTASTGKSNDDQFNINVQASGGYVFDYDVDWGDGSTDTNVTGSLVHTYAVAGEYDVKISGVFPNIYFFNSSCSNRGSINQSRSF